MVAAAREHVEPLAVLGADDDVPLVGGLAQPGDLVGLVLVEWREHHLADGAARGAHHLHGRIAAVNPFAAGAELARSLAMFVCHGGHYITAREMWYNGRQFFPT